MNIFWSVFAKNFIGTINNALPQPNQQMKSVLKSHKNLLFLCQTHMTFLHTNRSHLQTQLTFLLHKRFSTSLCCL